MKHLRLLLTVLCSLTITIFLFGCSKPPQLTSKTELVLGTVCSISIYDDENMNVIDECFEELRQLENILSINKPETELQKVNEASGKAPVKVSDDTFDVVSKGIYYSELSKGALDITIGPLVKLWGIGTDEARVPTDQEINLVKPLIDYSLIDLDPVNKTIFLPKKGMIIDLGAIAKGYAADKVTDILVKNNIKNAVIDLGGNIFALGSKIDGSPWKIGVQDPNAARNASIGFLQVSNKSIVTSGIYERYFVKDGKHYHHILNPDTGYPYENELLGVSIVTDKSVDGDSLSTTLFALGIEKGLNLINSLDGIDAIFITKDNELYLSTGIKSNFTLTNNDFKIKN